MSFGLVVALSTRKPTATASKFDRNYVEARVVMRTSRIVVDHAAVDLNAVSQTHKSSNGRGHRDLFGFGRIADLSGTGLVLYYGAHPYSIPAKVRRNAHRKWKSDRPLIDIDRTFRKLKFSI